MSNDSLNIFEASVAHQGYGRGPDDNSIDIFVFETSFFRTLFEAEFNIEGDDFQVVVRNFGLHNKSYVGSRTPLVLQSFSSVDVEPVKARIEAYFSSDEPKPYPPFSIRRARFQGVIFPEGWIVTKE